jgi:ribosome recycling factor
MLKENLITEDDERRAHDDIQKLTDQHVAAMDALLQEKETEIMEF